MFIWLFHRISGVTLIVLFGIKILTSYFLFTKDKKPDWALSLHRHPVLDILILVLFTFHSLYGLRTVAIDLGYRNEKQLFWVANVAATLISVALVFLYVRAEQQWLITIFSSSAAVLRVFGRPSGFAIGSM